MIVEDVNLTPSAEENLLMFTNPDVLNAHDCIHLTHTFALLHFVRATTGSIRQS